MPDVKSPYNFVPAPTESEVYKPDWAHQVSHDIPFSDGQSGEITLKITAETPIFIRNGHAKPKDGEEVTSEFSHVLVNGQKQYFIPATSIKGMLRNVLEIMSFSRMKQVDDDKFSIRDLSSNDNFYMQQMKSSGGNKTHAGWLIEDAEGNWSIIDCGEPGRINHQELKDKKGLSFRDNFLNKEPKNDEEKTARHKYELASKQSGFSFVDTFNTVQQDTRLKAFYSPDGKKGTIVFTGQPGKRKEEGTDKKRYNGKFYEFVFFESEDTLIHLTEKQKQEFLFVYKDNKKDDVSKDWAFWREKLKKGERVPVFFKMDKSKIVHFGLSYLYKLPYKKSIHELLPFSTYNSENGLDLTELIFGKISKSEKENSLKGRVYISHAFSKNAKPHTKHKEEILGSPKPSYFPFYLQQSNEGNPYIDYSSKVNTLSGFKRYPVHRKEKSFPYTPKQLKNKKIFSQFIPLEKDTTFECKIRFHNLRKVELGALISAIRFHGTPNLFHSLGGAKPYGFGKVKIELTKGLDYSKFMSNFEAEIQNKLKINWIESPQIQELFASAKSPRDSSVDSLLVYPQLELPNTPSRDANEFVNIKKSNSFLPKYSLLNGGISPKSLLEDYYKEKIQEVELRVKEALEKNEFEKAKLSYKELADLKIPNFNSSSKIKEIEDIEAEYLRKLKEQNRLEEEQKLFEDALTSGDQNIINQFLIKYPNNPRRKELEVVLANQGFPADLIETNISFNAFKSKIDRWIVNVKDVTPYRDELDNAIENFVRQQFKSNRTRRDWSGALERNTNWKKVAEWLGEERSKALYQKLINS